MTALILARLASTSHAQPSSRSANEFDAALRKARLARRDIHIDSVDIGRLTNHARPGSVLSFLLGEPLQTKSFMQQMRHDLLEEFPDRTPIDPSSTFWKNIDAVPPSAQHTGSATGLATTIGKLGRWGDHAVRRTLVGNPIAADMDEAAKPQALRDSIIALHARAGKPLSDDERKRLTTAATGVPTPASRAAALILRVTDRAISARDRAIRHFDRASLTKIEGLVENLELSDSADNAEFRDRLQSFEIGYMLAAAEELCMAAHVAASLLSLTPATSCDFRWDTPYGRITLDGTGDTLHEDDASYLLIIDLDGNDTYHAGAGAAGLDNPISILIDVRGNDRYEVRHAPLVPLAASQPTTSQAAVPHQNVPCAFGAGILGMGILIDCAGDDRYEVMQAGMGFGLFGVGVLDDWAGDDHYFTLAEAEGSATAGLGLLVDRQGSDSYTAYAASQGFAGVEGIAALIDLSGNDRYTANDHEIRYPSAQSPAHNNSMCQGAAIGNRADYANGYSSNGGVAILLDAKGDDTYTCGVFGQGTGYWLGAGFLIDVAGNDSYTGQWYVQGAAAHFAVGALLDEAGDDSYSAGMATSQGTGHDLSLGFLADLAGNDKYHGAGLTTGAGNDAGIGILIDAGGDDEYVVSADVTLGYANAPEGIRATMPCIGLFLDAGGHDKYSQPYAADNRCWGIGKERALAPATVPRYGIGVDTELTPAQLEALWTRQRR